MLAAIIYSNSYSTLASVFHSTSRNTRSPARIRDTLNSPRCIQLCRTRFHSANAQHTSVCRRALTRTLTKTSARARTHVHERVGRTVILLQIVVAFASRIRVPPPRTAHFKTFRDTSVEFASMPTICRPTRGQPSQSQPSQTTAAFWRPPPTAHPHPTRKGYTTSCDGVFIRATNALTVGCGSVSV